MPERSPGTRVSLGLRTLQNSASLSAKATQQTRSARLNCTRAAAVRMFAAAVRMFAAAVPMFAAAVRTSPAAVRIGSLRWGHVHNARY